MKRRSPPARYVALFWIAAVAPLAAQELESDQRKHADQQPLPGREKGSERWIVSFKEQLDMRGLRAANLAGDARAVRRWIAKLEETVIVEQRSHTDAIARIGGVVTQQFWIVNAAAIEVHPSKLPQIVALPGVWRLDPETTVKPAKSSSRTVRRRAARPTDANNHNAVAVHSLGYRGAGVTLAVLGSGADARFGQRNCMSSGVPHRMYFTDGDRAKANRLVRTYKTGNRCPEDPNGHETAVASVAAGADFGPPLSVGDGHAPLANIAAYNILPNFDSRVIDAWQRIVADKVTYNIKVANYSNGGRSSPLHPKQVAMDNAALLGDILVVAAAGNKCTSTEHPNDGSPSCANGLAVGAVTTVASQSSRREIAPFSARGPFKHDRRRFYPDIVACGVDLALTRADSETEFYGAGGVVSGTSFSAPQVAGAALLIRELDMSCQQAKAILLASAQDLSAESFSAPLNDRNAFGVGFLRDDRAMAVALSGNHGMARVGMGVPDLRTMRVVRGTSYAVAISWLREILTTTRWSDLQLEILDGATVIAASTTPRNLYELVRFVARRTGVYTVRVTADSLHLPQGSTTQEFGFASAEIPGLAEYTLFGHPSAGNCLGTGELEYPEGAIAPPKYQGFAMDDYFGYADVDEPFRLATRYQQMFRHSILPPTRKVFRGMAFRRGRNGGLFAGPSKTLEVEMGYTTRSLVNMAPEFARNFDSPPTVPASKQVVFQGTVHLPPTYPCTGVPADFQFEIPFNAPFSWIPPTTTQWNLVVQTNVTASSGVGSNWDGVDTSIAGGGSIRRMWTDVPNGSVRRWEDNKGLVTKFLTPSGRYSPALLRNRGKPVVGKTFFVDLIQAANNRCYTLFVGQKAHVDLSVFGAPGCFQRTTLDLVWASGMTTGGGTEVRLQIPSDTNLIGTVFTNQFLVLDSAPGSGFITSNGGEGRIGGW